MAPREFRHALDDMLEALAGIERATTGKSLEDYGSDWLPKHGVQRGIEIISEASRAHSQEVRDERSEIPGQKVCASAISCDTTVKACRIRSSGWS